jgi:hypothetical protein
MGFDLSVNMLWVCDCGVCLANKDTSMTMVVSYYPYFFFFITLSVRANVSKIRISRLILRGHATSY